MHIWCKWHCPERDPSLAHMPLQLLHPLSSVCSRLPEGSFLPSYIHSRTPGEGCPLHHPPLLCLDLSPACSISLYSVKAANDRVPSDLRGVPSTHKSQSSSFLTDLWLLTHSTSSSSWHDDLQLAWGIPRSLDFLLCPSLLLWSLKCTLKCCPLGCSGIVTSPLPSGDLTSFPASSSVMSSTFISLAQTCPLFFKFIGKTQGE